MTKKKKRLEERMVLEGRKKSRDDSVGTVDMTEASSKAMAAMSASMSLLAAGQMPTFSGPSALAPGLSFYAMDPSTAATAAALNASKQRVAFTAALAAKAGLAASLFNSSGLLSSPQQVRPDSPQLRDSCFYDDPLH
jgi:hypothetical protein